MNVLSIQSHVAYGHVGNAAAVFPLQRLGFEVWPVHTVMYSNHTGYPGWRGPVVPADDVAEVIRGLDERGVLARCDAVLSGYLGGGALAEVVLEAALKVKAANPNALYCCDPVMGDEGRGLYVHEDIPQVMQARILPASDIATPNPFELELLTGIRPDSLESCIAGARALQEIGPRFVLVTSLRRSDAPAGTIEMLLACAEGEWLVATPELAFPIPPNGAGDATAALFAAHLLITGKPGAALARAAASIFAVLDATQKSGARELALIAAQDDLVDPARRFEAVYLG